MRFFRLAVVIFVAAGCFGPTVHGAVRTEFIGNAGSGALYLTSAPGDATRLYIVRQSGQIEVYNRVTQTFNAQPFLDVGTQIVTGGERGLLGLAFHPGFETNGLFYVNMSFAALAGGNHDTLVRRYETLSPDAANPTNSLTVIRYRQNASNHNGGWMDFGPDGYLYISSGDGGSGGDPNNQAQDLNILLGKLLRLDVDGDDFPADPIANYAIPPDNPFAGAIPGRDEIWAYGLRNPWRCSFDRETGDLYIGDVGQDTIEEVDFRRADSAGGENYGWRVLEGLNCFDDSQAGGNPPCYDPDLVAPVYVYLHGSAPNRGWSVTGGYVYRGISSALQGMYFFADYSNDRIWSFEMDRDTQTLIVSSVTDWTQALTIDSGNSIIDIASFGEDHDGNLYIVSLTGNVFAIVPDPEPATMAMDSVTNTTVSLSISNLSLYAVNTVERGFDLLDTGAWTSVANFTSILSSTQLDDTVSTDWTGVLYRVRSE